MEFLDKFIFSDITMFDLRGKVNRRIVHICGTERQRADFKLHCDSPCIAPWVLTKFMDHYLLWTQRWLVRHIWTCYAPLPPYFCRMITMICRNSRSTNTALPYIQNCRWDNFPVMCSPEWDGQTVPSINWPPRSPDITTPDFHLQGYVKDLVYATQLT